MSGLKSRKRLETTFDDKPYEDSKSKRRGKALNYVWLLEDGAILNTCRPYGRLSAKEVVKSIPFSQKYKHLLKTLGKASTEMKCSYIRLIVLIVRESYSYEALDELNVQFLNNYKEVESEDQRGIDSETLKGLTDEVIITIGEAKVHVAFLVTEDGYDYDNFGTSKMIRTVFKFLKRYNHFKGEVGEYESNESTIVDRDSWFSDPESSELKCDINLLSEEDILTMVKYNSDRTNVGNTTHWRVKTTDPTPPLSGFFDTSGSGDWAQVYSERWGNESKMQSHSSSSSSSSFTAKKVANEVTQNQAIELVQYLIFLFVTFLKISFSICVNFFKHFYKVGLFRNISTRLIVCALERMGPSVSSVLDKIFWHRFEVLSAFKICRYVLQRSSGTDGNGSVLVRKRRSNVCQVQIARRRFSSRESGVF